MLGRALLLPLLLTLALPASAGDAAAERKRGADLLASLKGVDERLLGTFHFAYASDGKNVGSQVVKIERAPAKSGAVYKVELRSESSAEVGGDESSEVALLDAKLALVSLTGSSTTTMGDKSRMVRTVSIARDRKAWKQVTVVDGAERVVRFETGSPDYGQTASRLLVCRRLKLDGPHTLRLPMVFFDLDPSDDEGSSVEDVTFVVPAAAPFAHRGRELPAHVVTVEALLRYTVVVDPQGALLALWPGVGPRFGSLRHVAAADAEEARKDTEALDASPDASLALAAVVTWHEVLAGDEPFEALAEVSDWAALRDQAAERDPAEGKLTSEAFAERQRERTERMRAMLGSLAKDMLTAARGGVARLDGDAATVTVMGEQVFRLRRADGRWRIVRLPER